MAVKISGKPVGHKAFEDHLTQAAPQVVKSGQGYVSVTQKGKELSGDKQLVVGSNLMYAENKMSTVHVLGSRTVNLGNYESVKFECGVTMPCSKDDLDTAYDFCVDWVGTKIEEAVNDLKGEL